MKIKIKYPEAQYLKDLSKKTGLTVEHIVHKAVQVHCAIHGNISQEDVNKFLKNEN